MNYSVLEGQAGLTKKEEKELFLDRDNPNTKERIIASCLKLVYMEAHKVTSYSDNFADLVQEGIIGLIAAIGKYDTNKDVKFSTYAIHWIRKYILMATRASSSCIRVPLWASMDQAPAVISMEDVDATGVADEGSVSDAEEEEYVNYAVSLLKDEKHKFILTQHFGLFGTQARSIQCIADELGISRNAVNNRKKEALKMLKNILTKEEL